MSISQDQLNLNCNLNNPPEGGLQIEVVNVENVTPYVSCGDSDTPLSILKRCIVEGEDGRYVLQVHMDSVTPPAPQPFRMLIDTKANADTMIGGDSASVADWNTFFDLPANGTPFNNIALTNLPTGCQIDLYGGANIKLRDYVFGDNDPGGTSLLEVDDLLECIIECGDGVFTDYFGSGSGCKTLHKVNISACSTIGNFTFTSCTLLDDLSLDFVNINYLGEREFYNCQLLPQADYPNVTYIDDYCFYKNHLLVDPDFHSVTYIGNNSFRECNNLTNPNFSSLDDTGTGAFYKCVKLDIDLPELTASDNNAFYECTSLIALNIPKLTQIYSIMFYNCTDMVSINCPLVTQILSNYAFGECTSLEEIDLPICTSIGNYTFSGCVNLESINIPICVNLGETAGDDAVFAGITGKTITITIPHALEADGDIVWLKANNTVTVLYSD